MRKKIITIIGLGIIVVLLLAIVNIRYKNDHVMDNFNNLLNDNIDFISSLAYSYDESGSIDVTANYRGAHGENNPHDFSYLFNINHNQLIIGDSTGYNTIDNFVYLDLINYIADLKNNINLSKVNNNTYSIDTSKISDMLARKINSITFEVKTSGIVKKVNEVIVHIKYKDIEDVITLNGDLTSGRGIVFEKEFKYNKSTNGISLQYGDDFKMNIFKMNDHVEYNIVKGTYVYKASLYEKVIKFNTSGDASIYRGLDMTINFMNGVMLENNNITDIKNICILRYFNALGKVGSEY